MLSLHLIVFRDFHINMYIEPNESYFVNRIAQHAYTFYWITVPHYYTKVIAAIPSQDNPKLTVSILLF